LLFDLGPKDKWDELFGRDLELEETTRLIATCNWVVVLGPRMAGKTSFVKVVLSELQKSKRYETVYLNLRGARNMQAVLEGLAEAINANRSRVDRLRNFISHVLDSLVEAEIVEKREKSYMIIDLLLEEAL